MFKLNTEQKKGVLDPERVVRGGLLTLVIALSVVIVWSVSAPLSGAVIASGVVKVKDERKAIQHMEGGIVKDILVKNGDVVAPGQVLMVVGDSRILASVDLLNDQLHAEMIKAARLQAEKDNVANMRLPDAIKLQIKNHKIAEMVGSEQKVLAVRRHALSEQIRLLRAQKEDAALQAKGLEGQVGAESKSVELMGDELALNEKLLHEQFVSNVRVIGLKRQLSDYQANRSGHLAELAEARQKMQELDFRIINLQTEAMRRATDELKDATQRIFELYERLRPAADALERQNVRSPVGGEVVNLRMHTLSGVVKAGDVLMEVVPKNPELVIEANVAVSDIDEIAAGMDAEINLLAYQSRNMSLLKGKVNYVSADRLTDAESRTPFYIMQVHLDKGDLAKQTELKLTAGMPAEVFVKTRNRTLWEYMLTPVLQSLRRSMRET